MRRLKKKLVLAVMLLISVMLAGCQNSNTNTSETKSVQEEETTKASAETTRVFTDSAGREVILPEEIHKIAPSGPLAQIVLYTVAPDKLSGRASDFSEDAKVYIDEKYWGLPKFGQFYGKNANLNMEALIAAQPDVIVDIGEAKKTIKEDMDALQEQLGIPVVFVEADLDTMSSAYKMLGELTGETTQAEKLSDSCDSILQKAEAAKGSIGTEQKKSVYFATGEDGLHTNAEGSIHARVIEEIGAENAAKVEQASGGGGSEVSMEQLLLWQPDIILADSDALYHTITTDPVWGEINAVKEGHVYQIPSAPYSFMSNPPSVNRMIGILWLGNLVYPQQYEGDIKEEVKSFYDLFYHVQLSEEQIESILE